ncbi:MAG TPA: DUF456 domain-containing protein [Acidimicrobiales bacterium]
MDGVVVLVAVGMAVGIVGTVVPLLPGLLLVWGSALGYGLYEGFDATGIAAFTVITLLGAAGALAGWLVPQRAAGRAGAAKGSILVAAVGAVVGFFAIPVVGVVVGGLAGLYLAELQRTNDTSVAWRSTRATVIGFGLATLAQFLLAVAMAATWAVWVVLN